MPNTLRKLALTAQFTTSWWASPGLDARRTCLAYARAMRSHARPQASQSATAKADYSLDLIRIGADGLRAEVQGLRTLQATIAYWETILEHVNARRPRWLLVLDELRGHELAAREWKELVDAMADRGLEGVRIADVKPFGLDHLEYCEIYAREAGLDARAFSDEGVAER